jgi:hypothetical protein
MNKTGSGPVLFAAAAVLRGERQEVGTRDKPSRYQTQRIRYRLDTGLPEKGKGG